MRLKSGTLITLKAPPGSRFLLRTGLWMRGSPAIRFQPRRTEPDGTSSTRRVVTGIALRPGDEIRLEGFPDGGEDAAFDYIEIRPERK